LNKLDSHKFKVLFRTYYNPLCNFAASIVKDDKLAQDVVQDVFTQLWEKRDKVSISENDKSYLFSSVKNKAIEKLRKIANESQLTEVLKQMQDSSLSQQADKFVLREKINNSIRQLPPKCKEIFVMSKVNGLTYTEIAEELSISVKTVENQIGKAYRLLRSLISKVPS